MAAKPLLGMMGNGTGGTAAPPPSYTGPGDVIGSTVVWFGARGYTGTQVATGTQKAMTVRRALDNATQDILYLTSGALDNASAATFATVDATGTGAITGTTLTFAGGHIGDTVTGGTVLNGTYIVSGSSPTWTVNKSQTVASATLTLTWGLYATRLYNQGSGGATNDAVQATNSKQPQLILNAIGSLAALRFVSANSQVMVATITSQTQPLTFSAVVLNSLVSGIGPRVIGTLVGGAEPTTFYQTAAALSLYVNASFIQSSNFSGSHFAMQAIDNSSGSYILVNGGTASGTLNTNATSTSLAIGGDPAGGSYGDYDFAEGGMPPGAFGAPLATNVESNQRAYWGF